jgi:ribulose-5-phosphate 4-epimerase/fuculose-1-phosphate aldolase
VAHQEGIVKFELKFTSAPALQFDVLCELNAWRKILFMTELVGQTPKRYEGYGYGNVSQRLEPIAQPHPGRFAISGTQTGGLATLTPQHYAVVLECLPECNTVLAEGPIHPSAESLTHGVIYELDDRARFVFHAHSPEVWRCAKALDIPTTSEDVPYGTPEMAEEVRRLFRDEPVRERLIFAMGGHADGVIAYGGTAEEAGGVMLAYLARAFACA